MVAVIDRVTSLYKNHTRFVIQFIFSQKKISKINDFWCCSVGAIEDWSRKGGADSSR